MRIGITRKASSLAALIHQGKDIGFNVIPLPVTKIDPIPFAWPIKLISNIPTWIVITSANAVATFFNRLEELNVQLPQSIRYASIADKTSQSLQSKGYKVSFQSPEPYGESFFKVMINERLKPDDIIVYPRAKKIVNNPELMFEKAKIQYFPIICYGSTSIPLEKNSFNDFNSNDYILFTSPTAVISYQEQFGVPTSQTVAIGKTTAARMNMLGWQNINILPQPDVNLILEYVKNK